MRFASILAGSVLVLLSAPAHAVEQPALPDPIMTPGAVDPAATRDVVCNGTTRTRRHVSAAMKAAVFAAYNIPDTESPYYEIDHLVPLAIGGANTIANLWLEPWAEAVQKDALEVELQRQVCHGLLAQAEAQRAIADDWTIAYGRYVGGRLVAAPAPGPTAAAVPPAGPTVKARLKAEALRLARRWIFGAE
jgi:hypothetical protein